MERSKRSNFKLFTSDLGSVILELCFSLKFDSLELDDYW